jgi:hypothetical protein
MSRTRLSGRKSPGFNRFSKVNSLGKFPVDAANYASRGLSLRGFRPIAAGRATQRANRTPVSLVYGAGEGIRTLDPDLGKVVLYP